MNDLKYFYNEMETIKHQVESTFIFVYNDYNTYADDPHLEECFDETEVHEIISSICDLFAETLCFESEKEFVKWTGNYQPSTKTIYVYTMAQNISGYSRRTLVPAICEYYGFVNLNANAYMSALGCNKESMFKLLVSESLEKIIAPTIYIDAFSNKDYKSIINILGKNIVFKPISESCCIDNYIFKSCLQHDYLYTLDNLLKKYERIMIQKYIPGAEIGITVVFHDNTYYCLQPIQIVFSEGKKHLNHFDSFYTNYKLKPVCVPTHILEKCKKMSKILGFKCITRYDFRVNNDQYYLFDISPNPTINGYTSSNMAASITLDGDERSIFRLMIYEKFLLFEPSFNRTI